MRILFTFLIITLLTSCTSKRKLAKYARPIAQTMAYQPVESTNFCTFDFSKLDDFKKTVRVTTHKSEVLPLIFVYVFDRNLHTHISPKIVANQFQSYFLDLAKSNDLEQKLNGKKLEISIEQVPNSFQFTDQGTLIFLIFGYIYAGNSHKVEISPNKQNLKIKYRIVDEMTLPKEKVITIFEKNRPMEREKESKKRLVHQYMFEFQQNIAVMAQETLDQILLDL